MENPPFCSCATLPPLLTGIWADLPCLIKLQFTMTSKRRHFNELAFVCLLHIRDSSALGLNRGTLHQIYPEASVHGTSTRTVPLAASHKVHCYLKYSSTPFILLGEKSLYTVPKWHWLVCCCWGMSFCFCYAQKLLVASRCVWANHLSLLSGALQ